MKDTRTVGDILNEWQSNDERPLNEAMHPMQAIQAIQMACQSMEGHLQDVRLAYQDYGKGKQGSMSSAYSDEQLLDMIVDASEKMMRSAKKINSEAIKAVKAHKDLKQSGEK